MKKSLTVPFLLLFAFILIPEVTAQPVKLAAPFNDHMVLQQNGKAPIWGWARPGEKITLIPSWSDTIVVKADNASYPAIRIFNVARRASATPQDNLDGLWEVCTPAVFDPMTYARKMGVLVRERRRQFGSGLPVYFVQIAPYKYTGEPRNSAWLRDQQRLAREIPNTGMVVTSDIGDTTDIHPGNKRELGRRLANLALKNTYHKLEGLVESPVFNKALLYQGYVYIDFDYSDGLHFSEPERGFFEVADAKGDYQSVKAEIAQGKVRLDTRKIPAPQWVRFAFTNTATPVLFNSAGLPASCFAPKRIEAAPSVHMVSDLAHEFTFYADHRFDAQYLPGQKAVTNWCDLWHFDFSNANLLVLLGCDNRIGYTGRDIETIDSFLKSGGGVVVFGSEKSTSQNALLKHFGAEFSGQAIPAARWWPWRFGGEAFPTRKTA